MASPTHHNLPLLFILTISTLYLTLPTQAKPTSLTLTHTQQSQYSLQAQLSNRNLQIPAHLSSQPDWLIQEGCQLCMDAQCVDTGSCLDKGGVGVKCDKGCKMQARVSGSEVVEPVIEGKRVTLTLKQKIGGIKIAFPTVLVSKMSAKVGEIGRVNLFNRHGVLGEQFVMVKDNNQDITVHYSQKPEGKQKQDKQESEENRQQLLQGIKILKINNKRVKQLTLSTNQAETSASVQQTLNQFQISQLKLDQLYLANPAQPLQVPLTKTIAQLSIKTSKLLLPAPILKKFTSLLAQQYFPGCQFDTGILKCKQIQQLNLTRLQNITLSLTINSIQVQMPIRVLVDSCKQKECSFLLGVSSDKRKVYIGDFVMNVFAVEVRHSARAIVLHRLNNQWANNFRQFRKLAQNERHFLWIFVMLIVTSIGWLFKIILFLACVSLLINCVYHWREVLQWVLTLKDKQARQQYTERNLQKMRTLQQGLGRNLNNMRVRVKDRINKAMKRRKIFGNGGYDRVDLQSQELCEDVDGKLMEDLDTQHAENEEISFEQKMLHSIKDDRVDNKQAKRMSLIEKIKEKMRNKQQQNNSEAVRNSIQQAISQQLKQSAQGSLAQPDPHNPDQQIFYQFSGDSDQDAEFY